MTSGTNTAVFDPEQKKAIRHRSGPMLVLAGPGSGKTTVLTNRIRFLNTEYRIPEREILVLTFTRAAAAEMKERYLKLKQSPDTEVTFGTFHSVFYRILRDESDMEDCVICERGEALSIVRDILQEMYGRDFCPETVCGEVYDQIMRLKNGMKVNVKLPLDVYPKLEKAMRKQKRIDYDDMLIRFLRLLTDDPALLSRLRKRFRYILVDEFQDLNRTQYEILKMLTGAEKNIFAVGDDDQSIYGFRGSDPSYMRLFFSDFHPAKKVILTGNHRSTGEIVKMSVRLIRHNRNRFSKRLHSLGKGGLRPEILEFEDTEAEAQYIEKRIAVIYEAAEKAGLERPTFAILARTSAVLKDVADRLSPETAESVRAMTFHGSKGLEFDGVFIVGANEGVTPDHRALRQEEAEEERRAFYVAMTRAKKYLHIFNTKTLYNKPVKSSVYIREISSLF